MTLVEAGRLHLDDSAARLLPGTLVGGRALDPRITVRELLDHTSGLRDYLTDVKLGLAVEADRRRVWTPAEALAYAGKPLAAPGVGYHYANTNYVLLGLIAERLTGRTLAQEYRARFFDPLGMRNTFYQVAEPPTAQMPTAYQYSSVKLDAVPADVTDGTGVRPFTAITTAAGAAGSVAASAPDLARWAVSLYGGDVLEPATLETMLADATVDIDAQVRPAVRPRRPGVRDRRAALIWPLGSARRRPKRHALVPRSGGRDRGPDEREPLRPRDRRPQAPRGRRAADRPGPGSRRSEASWLAPAPRTGSRAPRLAHAAT